MTVSDEYNNSAVTTPSIPVVTTRFVPQRFTNRGAIGDSSIMPTATGTANSPVLKGEYPRTNWKYSARRNTEPASASDMSVMAADAALKRGFLKKRRFNIGWGTCISQMPNNAAKTKPPPKPMSTRADVQPLAGPWITA